MENVKSPDKSYRGGTKRRNHKGHWVKDTIGVLYVVGDQVQFADDFEHLANGFCRLLEVSEEQVMDLVEEWVDQCLADGEQKLPSLLPAEARVDYLRRAVLKVFAVDGPRLNALAEGESWGEDFLGNKADTVYAGSISGNLTRAVVGCKNAGFAWLIDPAGKKVVDARSITYDTAYFDDKPDSHYGMKQYLKHTDWRMQKARRFAKHMLAVAGPRAKKWLESPSEVSLLDVGSATGLFRAAAGECGLSHFGIDVSTDAIKHCKESFGFDTWLGSIFDLGKHAAEGQKFNIVTFWDVIEHLDRHVDAIEFVSKYLTDDGIVVVRTPNLEAMEATILGDMYYSYKLDHTSYFSVRSLDALMSKAGLTRLHAETVSHIFKGFLGVQYLYDAGRRLEGADILAVYNRPEAADGVGQ
jgi:2-polyprenyl-3-methyl-5-hydroxy-6-metoxy-1,4-benzoquinol methylase